MADIKLLLQNYGSQDDDQDDDEYSRYYESSMLDQTNPDDMLSPLEKLRKYCVSENIFTRQMVARSIVETAQSIATDQECASLLEIVSKLADDSEPSVRCELMEQLPAVCLVAVDLKPDTVPTCILPVVVKYLTDTNNQVRKLAQTALIQLMEQDLLDLEGIEKQVHPVLLQLTEPESGDDYRTEAVALLTKLTPLVGSERAERLFLSRFSDLCSDPLFHVRKVCASNFGDISTTVRQETTETILLPLFARLCEDGVWGVRKACAEAFMAVSGACSRMVKYEHLAPLFVVLLCDKSRWVQMAAYQALGQFIATFADPSRTGFRISEQGTLVQCPDFQGYEGKEELGDEQPESDRQTYDSNEVTLSPRRRDAHELSPEYVDSTLSSSPQTYNSFNYWRVPLPTISVDLDNIPPDLQMQSTDNSSNEPNSENQSPESITDSINPSSTELDIQSASESVGRIALVETDDIDLQIEELKNDSNPQSDSTENYEASVEKSEDNDTVASVEKSQSQDDTGTETVEGNDGDEEVVTKCPNVVINNSSGLGTNGSNGRSGTIDVDAFMQLFSPAADMELVSQETMQALSPGAMSDDDDVDVTPRTEKSKQDQLMFKSQRIVPAALLEHFVSMTEASKAQTIDGELPRHCAFTLPGVVLALGRTHWQCLKETYELLASDMQWKVRRTLAFSIHDLAMVLGEDITVADLVPVFNGFLKDLDEVRIGVLKHLNDFIQLLPSDLQKDYLHVFADFQDSDNQRNWRFRLELVQQLILLSSLYDAAELSDFIAPVGLNLAGDKVAEVRSNAFHLLCLVFDRVQKDGQFYQKFAASVVAFGVRSQHWIKRKACCQLYQRFLEDNFCEPSKFARDFLPSLLDLCTDPVPNIRLLSAKVLLKFMESDFYIQLPEDDETRHQSDKALELLQSDDDRDVRFFAGVEPIDDVFVCVDDEDEKNEHDRHDGSMLLSDDSGLQDVSMHEGAEVDQDEEMDRGQAFQMFVDRQSQDVDDDDEDDDDEIVEYSQVVREPRSRKTASNDEDDIDIEFRVDADTITNTAVSQDSSTVIEAQSVTTSGVDANSSSVHS